ncbi:MAG: hypothetical protein KTR32_25385 [Granulosicoccus sp.]|nr:hypothetical protein [Granulosicoccus sp.]
MASKDSDNEFTLRPAEPVRVVRPREPLYSMLLEASEASLLYLRKQLLDFADDAQLDDLYPEVGLTRRDYIEQVQIVINLRGI